MSNKRNHNPAFQNVKCDSCGAEAISRRGAQHRRCGGSPGAAIRPKHDALPSANKGKWQ